MGRGVYGREEVVHSLNNPGQYYMCKVKISKRVDY